MKRFTLISLMLLPFFASAAINDSSCAATFLDTLNYPILCGVNNGATTSYTFDNTTASSEVNQPHIINCGGVSGNNMNTPSPDTWYYFIASSTSLRIQLTPGTNIINNPQLGFYEFRGNCNAIMPRGCAKGSSGSLTTDFHNLIPGSAYMIQIGGGAPTDKGDGSILMTAYNNCNTCTRFTHLEADPLPVQGAYPPGKEVEFCFAVNGYNKSSGNALHAVIPEFGPGWDINSFQHLSSTNTNDGTGKWGLYQNIATPVGTKSGYFYDQYPLDSDPTNNYGDAGDSSAVWFFCFTIKTKNQSPCTKEDLAVNIHTFSDSQTGSNSTGNSCPGDTAYTFNAFSKCCTPIDLSLKNENCLDSCDGEAIATATGSGPWVFRWKDPGGNLIRKTTYPASATASDTLTGLCDDIYTVHVTDGGVTCTGYSAFEINPPKKHLVYVSDTGCVGSCNGKAKVTPLVGTPPYTYQWDDPANQTTQEATNLCQGFYNVIITDATSCAAKHQVYVFEVPSGDASFTYSKYNYCKNDAPETPSSLLMPGGTFSATPQGLSINNQTGEINFAASDSGSYNIRYITNTTCPDTAYFPISVYPAPPLPSVTKNEVSFCNSDADMFLTGSPSSYYFLKWYSNISGSADVIDKDTFYLPSNLPDGIHSYYLTQQDSDMICESDPREITVKVGNPSVDAGDDILACPSYSVMLNATGEGSFNWSPGESLSDSTVANPELVVEENTMFYVTLTDSAGCSAKDSVQVILKDMDNCELKIYSGFTPNGDGVNDAWVIDGISLFPENRVKIYTRWGKVIWEAQGYNNDDVVWKGNNKNDDLLPDATYFYEVILNNRKHAGWVELTR